MRILTTVVVDRGIIKTTIWILVTRQADYKLKVVYYVSQSIRQHRAKGRPDPLVLEGSS